MLWPAIFSGELYNGKTDLHTYFKESFDNGFTKILINNAFHVNLIPVLPMMEKSKYTNYYQSPNSYNLSPHEQIFKETSYLLDISLFRQLPLFLSKLIYNNNNWFVSFLFSSSPNSTHAAQIYFLMTI